MIQRKNHDFIHGPCSTKMPGACLCHSLWPGEFTRNRKQVVNRLKILQGLSTLLFRGGVKAPSRGRIRGDSPSSSFTYPLTAGVVGALQMSSQPVSSIFLCSPLPSGTWRTPGLSIPFCCLPTTFLFALSSSHFHCALHDGFRQT